MAGYDPGDMLVFAKVADFGSMSAAARILSTSKASVSRAVARLESALNARLVERSARHLVVTEVGRAFLHHCQRVAEEVREAEAEVGILQGSVAGKLRVVVPPTFGRCVLAPLLPKFLMRYEDIRMEVQLTNRKVDPIEEGFDLIVRAGPLADSSLNARELGRAAYGAYASPDYLDAHGPVESPADLRRHRVLDIFRGAESLPWEFERNGEIVSVAVRPRLDLSDAVMRRDAAIEGVGIALLPCWICSEAVEAGTLKPVCVEWVSRRSSIHYALWPGRRNCALRLRAFLDFLSDAVPARLAGASA